MSVRPEHARIVNQENVFFIEPICEEDEDSDVYLNGDSLTERTEIFHLDRVAFGANHMFVVVIADTKPREEIDEAKLDWDFAQNELYLKKQTIEKGLIEEK